MNHVDVDAALARMEAIASLPKEPSAWKFAYGSRGGITLEIYERWWYARNRLLPRMRKAIKAAVPILCRTCGASFYRSRTRQVNCGDCIAAAKRLRKQT